MPDDEWARGVLEELDRLEADMRARVARLRAAVPARPAGPPAAEPPPS